MVYLPSGGESLRLIPHQRASKINLGILSGITGDFLYVSRVVLSLCRCHQSLKRAFSRYPRRKSSIIHSTCHFPPAIKLMSSSIFCGPSLSSPSVRPSPRSWRNRPINKFSLTFAFLQLQSCLTLAPFHHAKHSTMFCEFFWHLH